MTSAKQPKTQASSMSSVSPLAKLGLISGQGQLPLDILAACQAEDRPLFVLGFSGQFDANPYQGVDHAVVSMGSVGKAIELLHQNGVQQVVMAGSLKRPSLFNLKLDARGRQLLAKIGFQKTGDDRLLGLLIAELESEGFQVVSTSDLLTEATVSAGVLGQHQPDRQAEADIEIGLETLRALSQIDMGQAALVQQGVTLAVEGVEGTGGLIARYSDLKKEGAGGVLVKAAKVGQDERVDLPTIGPDTVAACEAVGLAGIAIGADNTQIIQREETIARADKAGLFLVASDIFTDAAS